jgi:hypothetical protein
MHEVVLRDTPLDLVPEGLVLLQELLVGLPGEPQQAALGHRLDR